MKDPPFVIFGRDSNGTVVGYQGFIYEIVHALRELYNFTYAIKRRLYYISAAKSELFAQVRSDASRRRHLRERDVQRYLGWNVGIDR